MNNYRNITLKDLSEKLNLSVSTISRALKDHPDISKKTADRVKRLAKELNYFPNFTAQSLKNSRTNTIGVIIPNLLLDFSSNIINGMIHRARKSGYRLVISESGHDINLEKNILNDMVRSGVDGILLSLTNHTKNIDHILNTLEKCPMVMYDKVSDKVPCTKIIVDNEVGAYKAVQHLIDQGKKSILYINGPDNSFNAQKRYDGYLKALKHNNIEINKDLILQCKDVSIKEGENIIKHALDKKLIFDSVFAVTDNVAIGVIKALKRSNISIPNQVAVIGFSNSKYSTIIEPNLTSVNQPGYLIGSQAVSYLLKELELLYKTDSYMRLTPKTVELKTSLKIRESSNIF